jgi:hypothetical protein
VKNGKTDPPQEARHAVTVDFGSSAIDGIDKGRSLVERCVDPAEECLNVRDAIGPPQILELSPK